MAVPPRVFTIPVVRDRALGLLAFALVCGAVTCAGIGAGVEAAGVIALLAGRSAAGRTAGRYREMRFDGEAWTAVGADGRLAAIEPPVVHFAHRAMVVLEVRGLPDSGPGSDDGSDVLVFARTSTPPDDLRRLRVLLRAGGLSR